MTEDSELAAIAREQWKAQIETGEFRKELEARYNNAVTSLVDAAAGMQPTLEKLVRLGSTAKAMKEILTALCPQKH